MRGSLVQYVLSRGIRIVQVLWRPACFYIPTLIAGLLLISRSSSLAQGAAADLDPTFGSGGKVTTDFFGSYDNGFTLAFQTDGKVIVGGGAFRSSITIDFALARYNQNGTLDSSFGSGGRVSTTFPFSAGISVINRIAIQPDGKIVAAGTTYGTGFYDFALARYNADGSLDSTFGSQGLVVTDFFGEYDSITSLVLQKDGKIVVGGTVSKMDNFFQILTDIGLARYNSDGTFDMSFGESGKVTGDFTASRGIGGIDVQSDGKLIVVAETSRSDHSDIYVTRHNGDGSLDIYFGSNGIVEQPSLSGVILGVGAFITQPDGKIIIGGPGVAAGHQYYDFVLARINVDGSLDTGFGTNGVSRTDFGNNSHIHGIAVQGNGKIIAAGELMVEQDSLDFALSRFNSNGAVDPTFGVNGKLTIDFFNDFDVAFGVGIQSDGKIIAVGFARHGITGNDFALIRLIGDPTFDVCVQDDSNGNLIQFNSTSGDYLFSNCSGLTLSGIGSVMKKGSIITLQHYAPDRRVSAKIDGSVKKGTAVIQLFSLGTTFTITDRNTANNTCACPSALR